MDIVEHTAPGPLIAFIDEVGRERDESAGIMRIKRNALKPMTDQAFIHAIRLALGEADMAHVFFLDAKRIFIAWRGQKKSVYRHVRTIVGSTLMQAGMDIEPSAMTLYMDPLARGEALKPAFKATGDAADRLFREAESGCESNDMDDDMSGLPGVGESTSALTVTNAQIRQFYEIRGQKPYRKQLHILVVEDQIFSQKLLCEILRGARGRGHHEAPQIDTVQGIHDAWKVYLKKAPDLTFVDLNLTDGSGHTLTRAIKEMDPASFVVIVTANNYEEELDVARQNHADGFIAKPYNKKQILDCVERYLGTVKNHAKGGTRGATG